ncbi:MAG: hypothetical protein RI556_06930 [Hydrogenovibrio sp.]|uniref:hypothetical protein n=1 Tax=Hydrogenovibrio sp. TaxID=2065821 RepID=UPI00286FCA36|nr:hypothetical protein [Hydrogenovibrio sp.]MDR9498891.1 hypothetical protein [Hydrogenovibrio sp.]
MAEICPKCGSHKVVTQNTARKIGGGVGLVGGATAGFLGARGGMVAGSAFGPVGSLSGAIIGGLTGAASCGIVGAHLGERIDQNVLDNFLCDECGHTFSYSDKEPAW